jgi:hypothetical protein
MAELSKFFKIVLIINIIAAFLYGILYLIIPEPYADMIDSPVLSIHFWRLWGATCMTLGVFGIIGLLRNEWTTYKVIMELVIFWLIFIEVLDFVFLFDPIHTTTSFSSQLIDVIVILILIVLDVYAYLRENKQ